MFPLHCLHLEETYMKIADLILMRPFQTRNADEFLDENILELFVDPTNGVAGPFDYCNEMIKGKMGTGKTMYLRANYTYYLSILVPQMMESTSIILPLYIKLSDFQNIRNPEKIYDSILIRLIHEILTTCERIQSANELVKLHEGIQNNVFGMWFSRVSQKPIIEKLNKLTAEEYTQQVSTELNTQGTIGNSFLQACGAYSRTNFIELKRKDHPQIEDFTAAYESLLRPINCKILVLFDEVGSIDKSFFEERGNTSYFETLMNQLRTIDFIRTKIAIYPHTFADILTETRYGDVVALEDDIYTTTGYEAFLNKTVSIVEKYLASAASQAISAETIFDISQENMQLFEQIIYASDGNMRRLVQLLDSTLDECYKRCHATDRANVADAILAIKSQAAQMEQLYHGDDLEFLHTLTSVCKKRTAYRFKFPNKSPILLKYTNKSSEYNILKVKELGTGRRGTTYWFDYSYCLYADIPTHYQFNSERIARSRSKDEGDWIATVTRVTDELILQVNLPGKVDGIISYLNTERTAGFISDGTRDDYFFTPDYIIQSDRGIPLTLKRRVRFLPVPLDKSITAREVELL